MEPEAKQEVPSIQHFRHTLSCETQNFNQLCERWSRVLETLKPIDDCETTENGNGHSTKETHETVKEDEKVKEEMLGAIRTTIGQAKLLMSQRFKQFSDLIDRCEFNTGQPPTRLNDLTGFWEMIRYQIDDVMRKFKSLDQSLLS